MNRCLLLYEDESEEEQSTLEDSEHSSNPHFPVELEESGCEAIDLQIRQTPQTISKRKIQLIGPKKQEA